VTSSAPTVQVATTVDNTNIVIPTRTDNTVMIACLCGRPCKGRRGLRDNQRACRQLQTDPGVYTATPAHIINNVNVNSGDSKGDPPSPPPLPTVYVLPGIKLPKTKQQWEKANLCFKINFPSLPCERDISLRAGAMQSMIYK